MLLVQSKLKLRKEKKKSNGNWSRKQDDVPIDIQPQLIQKNSNVKKVCQNAILICIKCNPSLTTNKTEKVFLVCSRKVKIAVNDGITNYG